VKIDAFAHISPIRYLERVERILTGPGASPAVSEHGPWLRADPVLFDVDARWRALEPFGDLRQVLVLAAPPLEELGEPVVTRDLARLANDEMAALVRDHDRLAGFAASLPLNDVDGSLVELDRAVSDLGALGFQLYTNVNGLPLDHPRFEPLFARAEELDLVIWLHPTRSPAWPDYPAEGHSLHGIWWSIGWPYETAAAMCRLVYSGVLEARPSLRILTHHAGAMIPYLSGRFRDVQTDDQRPALERLPAEPLEYFHRFYADTAVFGAPHALRCAVDFFGLDHILFGTDMPLGGPGIVADTIADVESLALPESLRRQIYEGNARALLRLP
jgi:predicted TIM-barrel fold metal-dependent hydrolase